MTPPLRRCELYIDGASRGNPGPAGIGVVLQDEAGKVIETLSKFIGETTNNVAEYQALQHGLELARRNGCREIVVRTDSELLARQISGRYKVRQPHLQALHRDVQQLRTEFSRCDVLHVPREQNRAADKLAVQGALRRNVNSGDAPAGCCQ